MKKLFYISFLLWVVVGACKKESFVSLFDKNPEERISETIRLVKTTLTSAPNGWVATLPTLAGGGYSFYMSFDNNQNVTIYSDINDKTASQAASSTFRIEQGMGVMLVFDTYSYISLLQDSNPNVLGGVQGSGFSSDVEFVFQKSTPDSLFFLGRQYQQPLILVKATAEQKTQYPSGGFKTTMDKLISFFATETSKYIEISTGNTNTRLGVSPNFTNDISTGKRLNVGSAPPDSFLGDVFTQKIAYLPEGLSILNNGLIYSGIRFVKMGWKDANTLALYDANNKEYVIKESTDGAFYLTLTLADTNTEPSWGPDFIDRKAIASTILTQIYPQIRLGTFTFIFTPNIKKMDLIVNTLGVNFMNVTYTYTYVKLPSGAYRFTLSNSSMFAALISDGMNLITAERLETDSFILGYYTDPATGKKLGQFKSVEHPDFSFTGALK